MLEFLKQLVEYFIYMLKLPFMIDYDMYIKEIIDKIDPDSLLSIFACTATLSIAVIIFVAEIIRDKNNELDKKLFLNKTKLKSYLLHFIILCYLFLIKYILFKKSFLLNLIIIILLITFIYKAYSILKETINLITEKDYFNKSLDTYVLKDAKNIKNKNIINETEQTLFISFLKKQKIITLTLQDLKDYIPVYAKKEGIVESFDLNVLKRIVDKFNKEDINIIKLEDIIGRNINVSTIIAYIKKEYYKELENDLNDSLIYFKNREYLNDKINFLNENYCYKYLKYDKIYGYDNDNCQKIIDYFKYLYEENIDIVRVNCLNYLEYHARLIKDYKESIKYSYFLRKILNLSFKYNVLEDYKRINEIIYAMLVKYNSNKEIAYCYSNFMLKYPSSLIKYPLYYENNLFYLLKYIVSLIRLGKIDIVLIILDNINVPFKYKTTIENLNICEILNFQFVISLIHSLILFYDHFKDIGSDLDKLFKLIKDKFGYEHNAWIVVTNFKKYYSYTSSISRYNNIVEFLFEKDLNKNSIYTISLSNILKEYLYIFSIEYINIINKDEITKDDYLYFDDILNSLKTNSHFYKLLNKNLNLESIKSNLEEAKKISIKKAKENLINIKISEENKRMLLNNIKLELNSNELIKYLSLHNKVKYADKHLSKVYGIDELVKKDNLTTKDINIYYAQNITNLFTENILNNYLEEINKRSKVSKKTLDEVLSSLNNLEDYVLIVPYFSNIKDYNIDILEINDNNEIYLLKKKDLPSFVYCTFAKNFKSKYITKCWYREIIDLNTIHNIEEDLKEFCQLKIFLAYKINSCKNNIKIYKFIN